MRHLRAMGVAAGLLLAPPAMAADDPLEGMNRRVHGFNRMVEAHLLGPVVALYQSATSPGFRQGVSNAVANLNEPISAASGLMAGDPGLAWNAAARFGINTTLGLGGVRDAAAAMGYARHPVAVTDALCAWGVPSGPFLVLPLLGPTTLRDAGAALATTATLSQAISPDVVLGWNAGDGFITYADARDALNRIEAQSIDAYAVYRSAYLQRRAARCAADREAEAGTD